MTEPTETEPDCAAQVSQSWQQRPASTAADSADFLVLRRVCGGVTG
ncbi:MAG: hypothetical protein ACRDRL_25455 [Sciscionella sp.]